MTYTTEQAIALAREVGAAVDYHRPTDMTAYTLWEEELTALCNKVRKKTLLEAADELQKCRIEFLRRMAGEGE